VVKVSVADTLFLDTQIRRGWVRVPAHQLNVDRSASVSISVDAEGAVWYADVASQRCVRVREGSEILATVELDRGAFACTLSRGDQLQLCVVGQEWGAPEPRAAGQVVMFPAAGRA
jgi:sugar lactone lactonase YvrE